MKDNNTPFFVTTPIYYVTDVPHIGHLYTTVAADILARYNRMRGKEVFFLTGTDEHGEKIEKRAEKLGLTPQLLADQVVIRYKEAWDLYKITYDDFIRTTEERHKKLVTYFMDQLMKSGDIYLGQYEGLYCIPCESYWTKTQLVSDKCPDCNRPVEMLKEESYFFRLSNYQERLLSHINRNPDFILPQSRKNEVIGFIEQGLKDLSISRTSISWGIDMPKDSNATRKHKVYVWFDALTNYLSALSPLEDNKRYEKWWPNAIHLVGKDILRFHAVYWPAFLMALDRPLPKHIVAHGWLTDSNRKMSKSLGNVVDPISLAKEVGVEGVRYFLFREFVFGLDGEYTKDLVYRRINSDLANDFGNCINRLCNMVVKYLGSDSIDTSTALLLPSLLKKQIETSGPAFHEALESFSFHKALESVGDIVSSANKFLETNTPWRLAKSTEESDKEKLTMVLLHTLESLRISSLLYMPFIPEAAKKALDYLCQTGSDPTQSTMDVAKWGLGPKSVKVTKGEPIFPRLENKATVSEA